MAEIIVMPKMNIVMEEGLIGQWHKAVGDTVEVDDILFSVENEKEVADVLSTESGVLLKIWGIDGETYPVSTPVALIGNPEEDISEVVKRVEAQLSGSVSSGGDTSKDSSAASTLPKIPNNATRSDVSSGDVSSGGTTFAGASSDDANATPHSSSANVKMLPKLRKLIRDKGIDMDKLLAFTGKNRVTEQDIINYEASVEAQNKIIIGDGSRREPMSGMRRAIASNMMRSCENTARLTNVTEADMTDCLKLLRELKNSGRKTSVTAIIIKACAMALKDHEIINASLDRDELVYHNEINIGFAVDVPNGLVVPVIRNADKKDIFTIAEEITELSGRAKDGKLSGVDMSGGTFTVSNVGMIGVEIFTPLINYPQAAIMGIGTISRLPRYLDDDSDIFVPRHIMKLSLTYDHRIIDGAPAARFSLAVRDYLQIPALLAKW